MFFQGTSSLGNMEIYEFLQKIYFESFLWLKLLKGPKTTKIGLIWCCIIFCFLNLFNLGNKDFFNIHVLRSRNFLIVCIEMKCLDVKKEHFENCSKCPWILHFNWQLVIHWWRTGGNIFFAPTYRNIYCFQQVKFWDNRQTCSLEEIGNISASTKTKSTCHKCIDGNISGSAKI